MVHIGYACISTGDQTLDLQRDALREAGCIDIRSSSKICRRSKLMPM